MADPGFPRGGGANSPGVGGAIHDFAKISQKLHEIEFRKNLDTPLRSANALLKSSHTYISFCPNNAFLSIHWSLFLGSIPVFLTLISSYFPSGRGSGPKMQDTN